MSHKAIGHRDNGKVPRNSVVVPEESPRYRGSSRTNLQSARPRLKSLKFSRTAFCIHSMIITITMRLIRDEEDNKLWLHRRKYLLICTNCLRTSFCCIPQQSVEVVFSTSGVSMQPHSEHVGIKLLSELVMIKTKVTSNLSVSLTVTTLTVYSDDVLLVFGGN